MYPTQLSPGDLYYHWHAHTNQFNSHKSSIFRLFLERWVSDPIFSGRYSSSFENDLNVKKQLRFFGKLGSCTL